MLPNIKFRHSNCSIPLINTFTLSFVSILIPRRSRTVILLFYLDWSPFFIILFHLTVIVNLSELNQLIIIVKSERCIYFYHHTFSLRVLTQQIFCFTLITPWYCWIPLMHCMQICKRHSATTIELYVHVVSNLPLYVINNVIPIIWCEYCIKTFVKLYRNMYISANSHEDLGFGSLSSLI